MSQSSLTLQALQAKEATAAAMEKAARQSNRADLLFQAAWLWLEANHPKSALPLLLKLSERTKPEGLWLATLSHTHLMLEEVQDAAAAMERAAGITQQGDHYYRAAMLWRQVNDPAKSLTLLEKALHREPNRTDWRIELATLLFNAARTEDARSVLTGANLLQAGLSNDWRYRGARLWLNLDQPQQALPVRYHLAYIRQLETFIND